MMQLVVNWWERARGGRNIGRAIGEVPSSRGTACIAGRPRFFSGSAEEAGRPGRGGACWKNEEIRVLLRRGSALTGSLPALTVNVAALNAKRANGECADCPAPQEAQAEHGWVALRVIVLVA